MSGLSPERREELAQFLYVNQARQGEHLGTAGPWWDDADIIAPLIAGWLAEAKVEALQDFAQWVATNRAFNGSDHKHGQSLYNECINAALPTWATEFATALNGGE